MSNHEMLELASLYALDALDGTELASFESHLDRCPECEGEVARYQAIAANLVHDEAPSDDTWNKISAAIGSGEETTAEVVALEQRSHETATPWKWATSIAAAAALLLGGFLAAQVISGGDLDDESVVAAADSAADEVGSIVGEFLVDGVPVAQVVLAQDGRGFVIPTNDLEALGTDRTYQLWVVNDTSDVISAGVLGANPIAATFTWTGEVSGFALTREVAGGVVSSAGDVVSVIEGV